MAYPQQTVYVWQPGNDPNAPWNVSLSLNEIPAGIKVGVFLFDHKAKVKIVASEEAE